MTRSHPSLHQRQDDTIATASGWTLIKESNYGNGNADQHLDSTDTGTGVETVTVTLSGEKPLAASVLFMRVSAE